MLFCLELGRRGVGLSFLLYIPDTPHLFPTLLRLIER